MKNPLSNIPAGRAFELNGKIYKARIVQFSKVGCPCKKCSFGEDANTCQFTGICFAHHRMDYQSVYFVQIGTSESR